MILLNSWLTLFLLTEPWNDVRAASYREAPVPHSEQTGAILPVLPSPRISERRALENGHSGPFAGLLGQPCI